MCYHGCKFYKNQQCMRFHLLIKFIDRLRKDPLFFYQMVVLVSIYVGYVALYMGRATVVISGPAMFDDSVLDLSKTTWGAILG